MEFDVTLQSYGTSSGEIVRFQNNIQSIFNRVRLLYGATPLEDMINYNVIVRALTEWTSTNQTGTMDQTSISEGIGGTSWGGDSSGLQGLVNVRQTYIQGIDNSGNASASASLTAGIGSGTVPNLTLGTGLTASGTTYCTRRYQINLALGLMTQDKLLPVKFMASQLAIELTLEQPAACIFAQPGGATGAAPTYGVTNVNLIPEILEFDASYDAMFLRGLQDGGVPLKFSSWHTYIFSTGGAANVNLQVQERSRSVKALFAVQRRNPVSINTDSGAMLYDSAVTANTMQNYQWRIGGRYFPAQPVQLSTNIGTAVPNGGAEAFVELQKALNVVGDYRLSTSVNTNRWAMPTASAAITTSGTSGYGITTSYNEMDYAANLNKFTSLTVPNGSPTYTLVSKALTGGAGTGNTFAGNVGSNAYCSSVDLETSNGIEISGLNAEEQSDIAFIANWSAAQAAAFSLEVYSYYDAMIILRENNVLELIQ